MCDLYHCPSIPPSVPTNYRGLATLFISVLLEFLVLFL